MVRKMIGLSAVLCGVALAQAPVGVAPAAQPGVSPVATIRLLTIGNSFSGNATKYLSQITASVEGCRIQIGHADIGGCPLDKHWALAEKSEADPASKPYTYGGKTYSLKEMLQLEKWDVVTIQQASIKSFVAESYQPYADQLHQYIQQHAPQAKVMVHQTWAYGTGNDRLKQWNMTPQQMYDGLAACYATLAARLECPLLPSGAAFQLAQQKQPGIGLYDSAVYHANDKGCYLAGCAWFGQIFGISPEKITFVPKGLTAAEAAFLRQVAAEALAASQARPAAKKE
jgi:hypothetical protein